MTARPRVALIGCGRIGQVHLRNLLAHPETCELAMVVDANAGALEAVASTYRLEHTATDLSAAYDDQTIDAVIIASSTETHASCIEEAARSRMAALCEKPIALDLESTDRALRSVDVAGTLLQVGFQRRFDSGYARAKARIDDGTLGRIEMIRDAMRDPAPPPLAYLEKSGGLYRDMSIHNFDCVRWLKGEDPEELYATGSALTGGAVEAAGDIDTSVVTLRFTDGSLASIENSRRSGFGYDVRTEIFGSAGAMLVGDHRETPVRGYDERGVHEDHQHFFLERFGRAYEAEVVAFLEAVSKGHPSPVTGEDGRAAMVLAVAAEQSRSAGRPVRIKEVASAMPNLPSKDLTHA